MCHTDRTMREPSLFALCLIVSITYHPGLAEIPAPVGSQDVMSQMRDVYLTRPALKQILTNQQSALYFVGMVTTSWDPTGAAIFANPG